MKTYKAALIGCSRMGAFIDNEVPAGRYPYSHAAGYEACDRTELVACSDLRPEVMAQVGERYGVPPEGQYTDYREMMEQVQPDIVSVATQPEPRAEIVTYVANNGAKAIYAEKAMAASMPDADAMVEACESNGVFFNLGTNRRWDRGFDTMKEIIDSGRLGRLRALTIYNTSALFNGASHSFDLIMRLNSDHPALWVQGLLRDADDAISDGKITTDPVGEGIIEFENGVTGYALNAGGRRAEWEAVCEGGTLTALGQRRPVAAPGARRAGPQGPGQADRGRVPGLRVEEFDPRPRRGPGALPGHGRAVAVRRPGRAGQHRADFRSDRVASEGRRAGGTASRRQHDPNGSAAYPPSSRASRDGTSLPHNRHSGGSRILRAGNVPSPERGGATEHTPEGIE